MVLTAHVVTLEFDARFCTRVEWLTFNADFDVVLVESTLEPDASIGSLLEGDADVVAAVVMHSGGVTDKVACRTVASPSGLLEMFCEKFAARKQVCDRRFLLSVLA